MTTELVATVVGAHPGQEIKLPDGRMARVICVNVSGGKDPTPNKMEVQILTKD